MASKPPSIPALMDAVRCSKSYAALIRNGQSIPLNLAAVVFERTGWRHPLVAQLSDATVIEIAQKQPWSPPTERAA